jgi:glycerophosphoryl diester phosphodiesterase
MKTPTRLVALLLALLPLFALGGDFVTNPAATLPGPKVNDPKPIPPGADPNRYIRAQDYNALRAALFAVKGHLPSLGWDDATYPLIIGHRGSGSVNAPENTLAAFDIAVANGAALETDVQRTADGALVLMHDGTTTRTTNVAATVVAQTLDQLRQLDASYILPGPTNIFVPQRIPTFDEYLRRYGRTSLLLPEVKDSTDATAAAMARMIVAHGLTASVAIQSFTTTNLSAAGSVDSRIRLVLTCVGGGAVTPAQATANRVFAVFVAAQDATPAYVSSMHAVGVKVFAYNTANLIGTGDALFAAGVDGIAAEDPAYFRFVTSRTAVGLTTVHVPVSWFQAGGWRAAAFGVTGTFAVSGGVVTLTSPAGLNDSSFTRIQIPVRIADAPATQAITADLKFSAATAQTARWAGLRFSWTTDDDTDWNGGGGHTPSGYVFAYRRNGTVELTRVVAGVDTQIATTTWPAVAIGDTVPLRVNLTATSVTVTRTDTSDSVTADDAILPRGGLLNAVGSGVVPGIGTVTVTY